MWVLSAISSQPDRWRSVADDRAGDLAAIARIRHGDAAGLADLYDRHATAVYSLALRILRDRAAAEDAVQEVFAQAWRQIRNYDPARGAVGAWLCTLARSRAIDALRARRARPVAAVDDRLAGVLPDSGPAPEEQAIFSEHGHRIRQALSALPEIQRQAIELAFYEGLTHTEIAARLAEPLGTVKTRIRAGLLKLRDELADLSR
jgi:RNA polymerase sigma-70 factor (ECF subfamily)